MCAITDNGREGGERLTPLGIRCVIAGGTAPPQACPVTEPGGEGTFPLPP